MKTQRLRYLILGADLIWAVVALGLACLLRYGAGARDLEQSSIEVFVPLLLLALFLWSALSWRLRLDGFRGGWRVPAVLSQLFPAVLGLMAMLFAGGYAAQVYISRLVLGYFGVLLFLGFVVMASHLAAPGWRRAPDGHRRRWTSGAGYGRHHRPSPGVAVPDCGISVPRREYV